MKSELDTLFYPFSEGILDYPKAGSNLLFCNAQMHAVLKNIKSVNIVMHQVFKPCSAVLEHNGYDLLNDPYSIKEDHFDTVLLVATKNQRETENFLARSAKALKGDGLMVLAADNKSGGTRIKKMMEKLGFLDIAEQSKNKARVVWAQKPDNLNVNVLNFWISLDETQDIGDGFVSRLGLYGWNKVDAGSKTLATYLPQDLKGRGADFGCGYGYLSRKILEVNRKVKSIDYIDADYRALNMTAQNLEKFDVIKTGLWLDLACSKVNFAKPYDWIVMNPPFHEGKQTDSDIGQSFIKNAAKALRKKGQLWIVANNHLPYERVLEEYFFNYKMIHQDRGFKVFCAYK